MSALSLRRVAGPACAAALAALSLTTCETTTSPGSGSSGASGRIALGVAVSSSLAGSDSVRTYPFAVSQDSLYVVLASVQTGTVAWVLSDSAAPYLARSGTAAASSAPLLDNELAAVQPPESGTWSLVLRPSSAGGSARFSIEVYQVNSAPESVPAAFTIGDTVSGETIEPVGDVDVFTTTADSGKDFVLVAEAPTVSGLGPLALVVTDPAGATVQAGAFLTGVPATQTTGRIHTGTAGTYRFTFQGPGAFP